MATTFNAEVCVVGVGFVGKSLLECFSRVYKCVGFDVSTRRVQFLKEHEPLPNVVYTNDINDAKCCQIFLVSVPTPLKDNNTAADLSIVEGALEILYQHVADGNIVVLESSVAIGTTRRLMQPLLSRHIFCGFSPERVDPGRTAPKDWEIPKIISGCTPESLEMVKKWYSKVYHQVVPVSTTETAEMCKLYENCFRMVNIAYVNEISEACIKHGIKPLEMINASATKPFGFMPFYPGLFVGGTCIGVNPYYLKINCDLPLLYSATNSTEERPYLKATEFFEKFHPERVLVIGLGFKPGQSITVGSGSFPFTQTLQKLGVDVHYYDPLVESDVCPRMPLENWTPEKLESTYDLIVVCVRQTGINYDVLDKVNPSKVMDFSRGIF
jgi:nucleotide sugar dehydrogenase